jgi:hypothetical protein
MANTFVKIASVSVGSGGASTMAFSSIPATYTDLKVVISARTNASSIYDWLQPNINATGVGTSITGKLLWGDGASVTTVSQIYSGLIVGNTATATTFSNTELYFPNYTSSNYKSFSIDSVTENNATTAYDNIIASLWSNTAAITSLSFNMNIGTLFSQYSTATLYGIKSS